MALLKTSELTKRFDGLVANNSIDLEVPEGSLFAVIGPKGMSPAAVKKVHDAVTAAFADPEVREVMAKQGNTIHVSTPEQAQAAFRSELAKYAALVKKVGLEPQ